jgi:hypothetical protein
VIPWTSMPWLEDLKFPRGYQMGTHKILYECRKWKAMMETWKLVE